MNEQAIINRIRQLDGVHADTATPESGAPEVAWGDTFFIYDPDHILTGARRFPFVTLVTKDYGDFDNASNLNRPGVSILNPTADTFERVVWPLLVGAYEMTAAKYSRRSKP